MSSSGAARRRSGDPSKRATAVVPSRPRGRRRLVLAALVVAVGLVSLAAVSVRPHQPDPSTTAARGGAAGVDDRALVHAAVACDLTSKAEQAAEASGVGERARYAAAVLLLDQAITESGRGAESDAGLTRLDSALQAVHTAGHEGDHARWQEALVIANGECRYVLTGR